MKIIKNLLGGDSSDEEEEDESLPKPSEELDGSLEDDEIWPYDLSKEPHETIEYSGNEIHHVEEEMEDGDMVLEHYAGADIRELFEAHGVRNNENTWLGYTRDRIKGFNKVGIERNALFRHLAFFGTTGYGKSTVLTNLMFQWTMAGHGVCFIDPKGHDSIKLLRKLPESRLDDVVYVEPGNPERDKVVGFNFLDTTSEPGDPEFENEVSSVVRDLTGVMRAGKIGWGATMDTVLKAIARQLVRAPENYTILDMWKILTNEEERELFTQKFGDSVEKEYMNRLKEMDEDEFDPIIRRFEEWVANSVTRELVAHRESRINIAQAVKDGKIIIVDTSYLPGDDLKTLVSTSIVKRLWSAITSQKKTNLDPYFLVVDEFDKVSGDEMKIDDMFSMARSFELSICIANQFPRQLDDDIKTGIYSNADNLFSFNVGNPSDTRDLAKQFDVDSKDINALNNFEVLGQISVDGEKTDTIKINTFPPYPPRRSREEAGELIERKLRELGVDKLDGDEEYGVLAPKGLSSDGSERSFVDDNTGEEITEKQILACVHTGGIRGETKEIDGKEGWVKKDYVVQEMKNYVGDSYGSILSNAIEKIPEAKLKTCTADGGKVYMRLTSDGEREVFEQDTGSGGSSGKIGHKTILKKSYKEFTKLGYNVKMPKQIGEEQADGIAEPPIKPVQESKTLKEAKELEKKAKDRYPRLYELFGDETINLEAESTTVKGKPKQTIKNLVKGVEEGRKVIFLVEEGEDQFERWAVKCEEIFSKPPFVREIDESGNRWFYTESSKITLDDGYHPLQEGSQKSTIWKEKESDSGTKIVLENPDSGEPIAEFDDISQISNPSKTKFPYNYKYDRGRKKVVVRDNKGNEVETFEDTKEMSKKGNYTAIREPLIPEKIFPGGTYPDSDMWEIIVLPDRESEYEEPQIYRNGNLTPLHSGEESITDVEETSNSKNEKEEPSKEEEDNLTEAAMEGYMSNEGEPPEFVDNRDLSEDDEEEEKGDLEYPDKPF